MPAISRYVAAGLAAAPLAALMVVASPMGEAQALSCKNFSVTSGVGRNLVQSIAKRNARIKWRAKVRTTAGLGWSWSNWDKAKDKHYNCGKYGTIYKKWGCTARARPCK